MKTIVLYGHQCTAQAAYMQIDQVLRDRQVTDVGLVQTVDMDQAMAKSLRLTGAQLWYCGPNLTPPGGGWSPVSADRYLLAPNYEAIAPKALHAIKEFLNALRVAA